MFLRLTVIIALAAYLAPSDVSDRVMQSAYANSVDVVTLCERRPKDCEMIAEKVKETGVILADFAARAAVELRQRFTNSVSQVRQMQDMSALDRGTLHQEDLAPDWQGS